MPDLTRPEPEAPHPGQIGTVTTPPATTADPFTVTVLDFSGEHLYQIAHWQSRGATIPAVGDECLVIKDENGIPWVSAWWPAKGDVAGGGGGGSGVDAFFLGG